MQASPCTPSGLAEPAGTDGDEEEGRAPPGSALSQKILGYGLISKRQEQLRRMDGATPILHPRGLLFPLQYSLKCFFLVITGELLVSLLVSCFSQRQKPQALGNDYAE